MADEIDFESERTSNFQRHFKLTLTLNRATWHTVVHHSSTPTYVPNFIEVVENNFRTLRLNFLQSSKSRDTKTKTDIKNPARSNLDNCPLVKESSVICQVPLKMVDAIDFENVRISNF